ncbi:MAG: N-acetylneuraminate synthase family protein [Gammaproteobacteria bacterium]|nr:N-acetylneuraminate synthase family protein [Gammaproteobacteria bacterium]
MVTRPTDQETTMPAIRIANREIGRGNPVFVIAEAGNNHNGSIDVALRLIDEAAAAGCDAVKFQKRSVRALLSREAYDEPYDNRERSFGRTYGEHREFLELTDDEFATLRDHAAQRDIVFMASCWDEVSADFLENLDVPVHKIGSPDLTNLPLCRRVASFGKPVLLSTGMADESEVDAAVKTITAVNSQLVLLHCVSIYPTPPAEARLGRIARLRERYRLPVGYSGHERGWHILTAAVALGACVVEKHMTLDRTMVGSDHGFALEPADLASMVGQIREVEDALAKSDKQLLKAELPYRRRLGKSVATTRPIARGTILTADMLTCKSPATGLSPARIDSLIGAQAARDLDGDAIIQLDDVTF